jgi:hypothetical protein
MTAILQTPDTNSESQRLADNLLPRAAEIFRAHEQRIYRRGQMRQLMDLYSVETAPMLDGLGEAIQTNSSAEVARIAHELVGCSACCGVERSPDRCANRNDSAPQATSPGHTRCLSMFVRNFRASRVPSRNLSKHCRLPIYNP